MYRATVTVTVEDTEYTATGTADFAGPYAECEGADIEECDPEPADDDARSDIEDAIQDACYEQYQDAHSEDDYDEDDDWNDYPDEHDDYCNSRGGDYWYDPESGEPRCG